MALIGLSLLAVTFCFFVFRFPSTFGLAIRKQIAMPEEKHAHDNSEFKTTKEEAQESSDDEAATPKASATHLPTDASVPSLNLQIAQPDDDNQSIKSPTITSDKSTTTVSSSSAGGRSSSMLPPPPRASSASLMPPPAVKASALRPLPKLSGSLAPPPSAASSLRNKPNTATNNLAISASTSTLPPNKRPSKKVLLDPGHSPLDWANLIKDPRNSAFLRGADIPPHLIKVTPSQLKTQSGRKGKDAWGTYQGKIYNLTPYLNFHPGGKGELLRGAGKVGEAERLFVEIHPWVNWDAMLSECLVGILVSDDSSEAQDLEAMD